MWSSWFWVLFPSGEGTTINGPNNYVFLDLSLLQCFSFLFQLCLTIILSLIYNWRVEKTPKSARYYFHVIWISIMHVTHCLLVQFSSVTQSGLTLCATWTVACQAFLYITNSWSLLKLIFIESVMPSNHLIIWSSLLLPPSIFPSIRVFSNESVLRIRWPKYWSFSFSISPSNEYSGLISFRIDLFELFAVQGTLKGLLQHHSSKASILQCSVFFVVRFSHPYMTTGKIIHLRRWTFVCKVMSLLFNMLSRLVIVFLPKSKCLLIPWLQSTSAVILEPKKIKSVTVSIISPSIFHGVMRPEAMISIFWMLSFKPVFHSHQETLQFLFSFCHKGGVIYISEVIVISPSNLDSSLCFIQLSVLCSPHRS